MDTTLEKYLQKCTLVNKSNEVIGSEQSELLCINIEAGMLRRAFSVFLLNQKGAVATEEIKGEDYFPILLDCTCCSHPLYNPEELDETDNIGLSRAARRINQECLQNMQVHNYSLCSRTIWSKWFALKHGCTKLWLIVLKFLLIIKQ